MNAVLSVLNKKADRESWWKTAVSIDKETATTPLVIEEMDAVFFSQNLSF